MKRKDFVELAKLVGGMGIENNEESIAVKELLISIANEWYDKKVGDLEPFKPDALKVSLDQDNVIGAISEAMQLKSYLAELTKKEYIKYDEKNGEVVLFPAINAENALLLAYDIYEGKLSGNALLMLSSLIMNCVEEGLSLQDTDVTLPSGVYLQKDNLEFTKDGVEYKRVREELKNKGLIDYDETNQEFVYKLFPRKVSMAD